MDPKKAVVDTTSLMGLDHMELGVTKGWWSQRTVTLIPHIIFLPELFSTVSVKLPMTQELTKVHLYGRRLEHQLLLRSVYSPPGTVELIQLGQINWRPMLVRLHPLCHSLLGSNRLLRV